METDEKFIRSLETILDLYKKDLMGSEDAINQILGDVNYMLSEQRRKLEPSREKIAEVVKRAVRRSYKLGTKPLSFRRVANKDKIIFESLEEINNLANY